MSPHSSVRTEIKSTSVVENQDPLQRSLVVPFLRGQTKALVESLPVPEEA